MGRFALLLLLFTAPLVAAPVPKAVKKAPPTLQGVWEVVERRNDGQPLPKNGTEVWVIDETGYAIYDGVQGVAAITDPTVKPYLSKWKHTGDDPTAFDTFGPCDNVGKVELDGDTLRIGFDISNKKVRPAEAKPGQGVAFILFKRVDDPRPKAK